MTADDARTDTGVRRTQRGATVRPPMFIMAGMPRAGTTFMYRNLQKHPSVFLPFRKETDYFSHCYSRGLEWYAGLYEGIGPHQIGGDISPSYFLHAEAIERIVRDDPDAKVILAIRDPAEVALSLYRQFDTYKFGMPPFESFIDAYDWHEKGSVIHLRLRHNMIAERIERFRRAFGDHLLIYSFEVFRRDALRFLRAVERFCGLPAHFEATNFDDIPVNASGRQNSKLVSYLISRESFVSFMNAVVPRRGLQGLRNVYDRWVTKDVRPQTSEAYPPDQLEQARQAFSDQRAYVDELFADAPIQLGSGRPFPVGSDIS